MDYRVILRNVNTALVNLHQISHTVLGGTVENTQRLEKIENQQQDLFDSIKEIKDLIENNQFDVVVKDSSIDGHHLSLGAMARVEKFIKEGE